MLLLRRDGSGRQAGMKERRKLEAARKDLSVALRVRLARAREEDIETGHECFAIVMHAHLIRDQVNERILCWVALRPPFDDRSHDGRSSDARKF